MSDYYWNERFLALFRRCLEQYDRGNTNYNSWYSEDDLTFLRAIGCKPRELFDFVEDHSPEMPESTALLVAAVRRDYFVHIQGGKPGRNEVKPEDLPPKPEAVAGIPWLPRIIAKAKAKLRGEMHPDIMFGCGGDRAFLTKFDIHPADFLRVVWAAEDNDQKVIDFVKSRKAVG
jgi:hypothetical protein